MGNQLLVIKANVFAGETFMEGLRKSILKQKESGVIVLPFYCDALLVPDDVEIRVESSDSDRT